MNSKLTAVASAASIFLFAAASFGTSEFNPCAYNGTKCPGTKPPTAVGNLMPFGGHNSTCLVVNGASVTVGTCSGTSTESFVMSPVSATTNGSLAAMTIKSGGLCLDVPYGTEPGKVAMATCDGTSHQLWYFEGGQLVSDDTTGGRPYCLDVASGNTSTSGSAVVDIIECNGEAQQEFAPAGTLLGVKSLFVDSASNGESECLDILNNNQAVGGTLDNADCDGTEAQSWILTTDKHISPYNSQDLCLGLVANPVSGLAQTDLQACSSSANQEWYLANASTPYTSDGRSTFINMGTTAEECLNISGNSVVDATTVDALTCNEATGQLWEPFLAFNAPPVEIRGCVPSTSCVGSCGGTYSDGCGGFYACPVITSSVTCCSVAGGTWDTVTKPAHCIFD